MRKRTKETKSLETLKKGFRKNEVVIYAIALMLVTAGYFNYTANLESNSLETYSEAEDIAQSSQEEKKDNISSKEENNIASDEEDSNKNSNNEDPNNSVNVANNEGDDNSTENKDEDKDIGDAKLVNSNDVVNDSENNNESEDKREDEKTDNSSDYFVSSKLERDTNYADMISTYTKIIEDSSVSETQKAIAMKEITKITDTKNAISVCENILSTKGFENYIVLVNNDNVNVVVEVKDGLTKEKVAQIQNIVSRELNSKIENIHITEKQ